MFVNVLPTVGEIAELFLIFRNLDYTIELLRLYFSGSWIGPTVLQQLEIQTASHGSILPPHCQEVNRLDTPSSTTLESLLNSLSGPVLITNHWSNQAIGSWTLDYLAEHAGDQVVEVEHYPTGNRSQACTFLQMPLRDYLIRIQNEPTSRSQLYLAEYPLSRVASSVLAEFTLPKMLERQSNLRQRLFMGIDTVTTAHYHRARTQALLGQISGHKQVVLFPPSQLGELELNPWYSLRPNHSRLQFGEKPFTEIVNASPALQNCTPYACVVQPGELLFIPDHWVHYVVSEGESVSVTWFWDSEPPSGYLPGIRRDRFSYAAKKAMVLATKLAGMMGLQPTLVAAASKIGVLSPDEKDQVNGYLSRFGATTPSQSIQNESNKG